MTITVTIKNDGPHRGAVIYYNESRQFKEQVDTLMPGDSITVNVWDGHLPVVCPWEVRDKAASFFAVPPATYFG
jgi:hypothetical protein